MLLAVETIDIVARKRRGVRNGIVRRVTIDEVSSACIFCCLGKIHGAKLDAGIVEVMAHGAQYSSINDVGFGILAEWHIELPLRVHTEKTVVAGLVQIDDPRGSLKRWALAVAVVAVPVTDRVIVFRGVVCLMLSKRLDEIVNTVPHNLVAIDQLGVRVVDHRARRLEREQHCCPSKERLIICSIPLWQARKDLGKELALAAGPLQEGAHNRIWVLGHLVTCT